jgi:hypothetical protein
MEKGAEEREMTQEELMARKEEMLNFYKDSLPYIQAQCEYEELLARIDEARFKRAEAQIKYAMMMQGPQKEDSDPTMGNPVENTVQEPSRKLKKN